MQSMVHLVIKFDCSSKFDSCYYGQVECNFEIIMEPSEIMGQSHKKITKKVYSRRVVRKGLIGHYLLQIRKMPLHYGVWGYHRKIKKLCS